MAAALVLFGALIASIRGQIEATKNIITILKDSLEILNRQYSFGSIAKADVVAQEAALAQAEQALPPLEKQLALQRDLLTALAGRFSFDEIGQKFSLSQLKLPVTVPVSVPSLLVEQRPDIRAAEANLHAATATVGVARASRLPNITLSANLGASAFHLAQLFAPGTGFYPLAANAAQPLFDGMTLLNKERSAVAALEQADAQYRSTVINAFQNVTDALRSLQSDARAVETARKSEDAAKRSLDIVRMQLKYDHGLADALRQGVRRGCHSPHAAPKSARRISCIELAELRTPPPDSRMIVMMMVMVVVVAMMMDHTSRPRRSW